jgi:hypothetical protein
MGKSALRLVLAQCQVVAPQKGDQPPYVRSKHSIQTSSKLKRHQRCVAEALRKKKFPGGRAAVRKAFKAASEECAHGS